MGVSGGWESETRRGPEPSLLADRVQKDLAMKKLLPALAIGIVMLGLAPASAFEFRPYEAAAVDAAIASGKPVVPAVSTRRS